MGIQNTDMLIICTFFKKTINFISVRPCNQTFFIAQDHDEGFGTSQNIKIIKITCFKTDFKTTTKTLFALPIHIKVIDWFHLSFTVFSSTRKNQGKSNDSMTK